MIPAPGQGFRTGLDIQFIAIPFPLPDEYQRDLVKVGQRAMAERKAIELCKDGEKLKRVAAEKRYQQAVSELELIEISIRHAAGVVHTRPCFLAAGEK